MPCSLRRRFEQNQQDVSFTIMALLPTLGAHIIEGMDVEGVTRELQSQSRISKPHQPELQITHALESSASSSAGSHLHPEDARSDNGSVSVISFSGQDDAASTSEMAASSTTSTSWVDARSSPSQTSRSLHHSPEASGSNAAHHSDSPQSNVGAELSDSMISGSSISYGDVAVSILRILVRCSYVSHAYTAATTHTAVHNLYAEQSRAMERSENAESVGFPSYVSCHADRTVFSLHSNPDNNLFDNASFPLHSSAAEYSWEIKVYSVCHTACM